MPENVEYMVVDQGLLLRGVRQGKSFGGSLCDTGDLLIKIPQLPLASSEITAAGLVLVPSRQLVCSTQLDCLVMRR